MAELRRTVETQFPQPRCDHRTYELRVLLCSAFRNECNQAICLPQIVGFEALKVERHGLPPPTPVAGCLSVQLHVVLPLQGAVPGFVLAVC